MQFSYFFRNRILLVFFRMFFMPQYAVFQSHPPDVCPLTNKSSREFIKQKALERPSLQEKLGVKTVLDIHLDPAHKVLTVFEASSAEAVRDYLIKGGFMHIFEMEFYLVTPLEDIMKQTDDFPTIF